MSTKNLLRLIKEKNKVIINQIPKSCTLVTFLNPHAYKIARCNIELYNKIDILYIDGFSVVKLLNLFNIGKHSRRSFDMTSLAKEVFENAERNGIEIYFVGTEPQKISMSIDNIKKEYPNLIIAGFRHGYFNDRKEWLKEYETIINSSAKIVIVGMGAPLQEEFILGLKEFGYSGLGYTCGGFLHQITERINYFPRWSDKYNLRWFYRIIKEPKVSIKRSTIGMIQFIFYFFKDLFFYKIQDKK